MAKPWAVWEARRSMERNGGKKPATLEERNYRIGNSSLPADLVGADLRGLDLEFCSFDGLDMREANLSNTPLGSADFRYADLRGADLSGCDVSNTWFQFADLRGANLSGVHTDRYNPVVRLCDAKLDPAQRAYLRIIGLL